MSDQPEPTTGDELAAAFIQEWADETSPKEPIPTTGEWTVEYVKDLLGGFVTSKALCNTVANTHNAALAAEREKVQTLMDALKTLRGWTKYVRLPCGQYSLAPLEKAETKADAALAKVKEGK